MATQLKSPDDLADDAPTSVQRGPEQDADLAGWAFHQAMLLRSGQLHLADAALIAEELEDVGHEQYDKFESALRLILAHMLKWDHQPERRSRSWQLTIANNRDRARRLLEANPSFKSRRDDAVQNAYRSGRREAYAQTKLPLATFPDECPYGWADLMNRRHMLDGETLDP
ncbi:DUF29 domain-containing protein [Sandarakinorhabdus sp.]|jgi:hypothetical protein|uniref:DUF29 domain-containing protein n=1 Tax=Sandarakinorhabdus sp. TaxID=1916663 RepID=UPI003340B933